MPSPVRVGATRGGSRSGGATTPAQTYPDTMSGYGPTRADSVGYNARNPYAYQATQAAKAYNPRGAATVDSILKGQKGGTSS